MGVKSIPVLDRFMARIERRDGPLPDQCWIYNRNWSVTQPYPTISVRGKKTQVNRAMYSEVVGPIPAGLLVLHKCDNPLCVNPSHLRTGTQAENMKDRTARGRCNSSEMNKRLSETQRRDIYYFWMAGVLLRDLSRGFDVTVPSICRVVNRAISAR